MESRHSVEWAQSPYQELAVCRESQCNTKLCDTSPTGKECGLGSCWNQRLGQQPHGRRMLKVSNSFESYRTHEVQPV